MSILDKYHVQQITSKEANDIVVKYHYLHRKASCMYAYGLFHDENLIGVIIYGKPASPALCKGVCGEDEASKVIELTRLWIQDGTEKNTESYFIGQTLKMLPKEKDIIVSYAEIRAGHVGTVYQATNWIYTGMSDKHVQWLLDGIETNHSRHLFDQYGGINGAKKHFGERMIAVDRPRKHRYIFFNADKKRRKELKKKLRYKIQPYPKRENNQ